MKNITIYFALVYALVFIAASAGCITHGVNNAEPFFTVIGILNFVFGCYGAYKVWRSENPKQ